MHGISTLPTAEATILPLRPDNAGGDNGQRPAEPLASSLPAGVEGIETYQADRGLHAMLARLTAGISPAALHLAYTDWLLHLAASPQRQIEIAQEAVIKARRLLDAAQRFLAPGQGPWSAIEPLPQDRR